MSRPVSPKALDEIAGAGEYVQAERSDEWALRHDDAVDLYEQIQDWVQVSPPVDRYVFGEGHYCYAAELKRELLSSYVQAERLPSP